MKNEVRNKIILHGNYFDSFLKFSYKEGYAIPAGISIEEYKLEFEDFDFHRVYSNRSEILQMLLIYDEISFIDPVLQFDLSKLQKTGLIKVVVDERALGYLKYEDTEKDILMQIKPIIIDRLKKDFNNLYSELGLNKFKISYSSFLSVLYDFHVITNHKTTGLTQIESLIIDKYLAYLENQIIKRGDALYARKRGIDEETIGRMISLTFRGIIEAEVGTLLCLLDMSSTQNGVLMQDEFKFDKVITASALPDLKEGTQIIEGYKILKLSYQKLIDTLPALNTIDDVLKLKEKKHKEIKELQQILSEIEIDLRNGRIAAIKNADSRIKKSINDLNRNQKIQKVNRWLTYISIPIGIIETILHLPPIMGFSVGAAGVGTTLRS
ncbi:MAG: hypothetical protein V4577_15610 [Bacteroidota bacterium]